MVVIDLFGTLNAWRQRHMAVFRATGAALAGLIALWFVSWLLVGDGLLLVRWGAFAAPLLATLSLVAAGMFALGRRPWWGASATGLALLILLPVIPRFNPARWFRTSEADDLRVMTFNSSTLNTDYAAVAGLIVREHPDIVFLQQTRDLPALLRKIRTLPGSFQYQRFPTHAADAVILSRFALSNGQEFPAQVGAVIAIDACHVRLWSLHAPHGQLDIDTQQYFFEQAALSVADEKLPVIAGGDLNSTEFNSDQAPLRAQLIDAFATAGAGLGFTFPSHVRRFGTFGRLFRIDYIFFRGLVATAAWTVGDNAKSDHFPVEATFRKVICK